ncbi:hypothetical protein [Massilia sp. METH4]|uniref:hypothetical protein n=1 Tax=Massilia sp. METH4 TaxID=3123041 RepID=UPI0030CA8CDC
MALPVTLLALLAAPVHAGTSKAAAIETAAAKQERAERAAFLEKQKAIADERGTAVEPPARGAVTVIDMPQDETDAPGAVKK